MDIYEYSTRKIKCNYEYICALFIQKDLQQN